MSIDAETRRALLADAADIWTRQRERMAGRFSTFIPTDYEQAYEALQEVRDAGETFVELGSGAGVVTILADLLGFDAYGIELDDWLLQESIALAEKYGSRATFVGGSFVPMHIREEVEHQPADFVCETEGADAYEELGMELSDFDVIYDYYWPDQDSLHTDMLVRCARPGTVILRFSEDEGFDIRRL